MQKLRKYSKNFYKTQLNMPSKITSLEKILKFIWTSNMIWSKKVVCINCVKVLQQLYTNYCDGKFCKMAQVVKTFQTKLELNKPMSYKEPYWEDSFFFYNSLIGKSQDFYLHDAVTSSKIWAHCACWELTKLWGL